MRDLIQLNKNEVRDTFANLTPPWGSIGYVVYKRTYARFIEEENRTEEWWETILRCINSIQKDVLFKINAQLSDSQLKEFYKYLFHMKIFLSGRKMWQLGTKLIEDGYFDSCSNCWVVQIKDIRSICFLFEQSLLGGGVTHDMTKIMWYPDLFPETKRGVTIRRVDTNEADFIVPDDRKGWVRLLEKVLTSFWFTGESFTYSLKNIRPYGVRIKGFGGFSCGPDPLETMIKRLTGIFNSAGTRVSQLNLLDICNILGYLVNETHRRNAQLCLGCQYDANFLMAKRWDLQEVPHWRSMSNNTVLADNFIPSDDNKKFWQTYELPGEPLGMYNLELCKRKGILLDDRQDKKIIAPNPCLSSRAIVLTPIGLSTIGAIGVGDYIWSKEGWTKVIDKWSTGIKEVYEYKTNCGSFLGTNNHVVISYGRRNMVENCQYIDKCFLPHEVQKESYTPYKIVEKKFIAVEEVFDITVDNTSHTFWCDGLNISNCAEQNLEDYEDCLKCSFTLPYLANNQEFQTGAKYLYITCKGIRRVAKYLYHETEEIAKRNMRMGLSVGGFLEKHHFTDKNLLENYRYIRELDKLVSKSWQVPESIRLTDVQPEGTKSCLWGYDPIKDERYIASPGGHPIYFKFGIRRVRMSIQEPLVETARKLGYTVAPVILSPGKVSDTMVCVEFPCKSSDGAVTAGSINAIEQLEIQKRLQTFWADASVSMTCYYSKDELEGIKNWLRNNYENSVKAISFLQKQDSHGFVQPVYEELTEERYREEIAKVQPILSLQGDTETDFLDGGCIGDKCSIR